jgi:hypothetical protein
MYAFRLKPTSFFIAFHNYVRDNRLIFRKFFRIYSCGASDQHLRLRRGFGLKAFWDQRGTAFSDFRAVWIA